MSTYSQYKKLEKPISGERYDVNVFNRTTDMIDSELHRLDLKNQSQDELLATKEALNKHVNNRNNPHEVSAEQLALGNVDNTSDMDKPVSTAQREAIDDALYEAKNYVYETVAEHSIDNAVHLADDERAKWNEAHEHSQTSHSPSDAEKNIIVGIKKNGQDIAVADDRTVDIIIPTKTSDLTNDSNYISTGNAGTNNANKIWSTDDQGNPSWKNPDVVSVNIDNESIQRDAQDRLSAPALSRVFRRNIVINSATEATLYPLLDCLDQEDTAEKDKLQVGDLFFCDIIQPASPIQCQPSKFNVASATASDKEVNILTCQLRTINSISAVASQGNTTYIPYISSAYNKTPFTILRYAGGSVFYDLMNGYTNYSSSYTSSYSGLFSQSGAYNLYKECRRVVEQGSVDAWSTAYEQSVLKYITSTRTALMLIGEGSSSSETATGATDYYVVKIAFQKFKSSSASVGNTFVVVQLGANGSTARINFKVVAETSSVSRNLLITIPKGSAAKYTLYKLET